MANELKTERPGGKMIEYFREQVIQIAQSYVDFYIPQIHTLDLGSQENIDFQEWLSSQAQWIETFGRENIEHFRANSNYQQLSIAWWTELFEILDVEMPKDMRRYFDWWLGKGEL